MNKQKPWCMRAASPPGCSAAYQANREMCLPSQMHSYIIGFDLTNMQLLFAFFHLFFQITECEALSCVQNQSQSWRSASVKRIKSH